MLFAKLKGRIKEKFGTQQAFAEAMEISTVTISMKLNGKIEWKSDEIAKASELLEIPLEEVGIYFIRKS